MKTFFSFKCLTGILIAFSIISCNNKPQFTIEGIVADGDKSVVYLERRGLAEVSLIDSVVIGSDGSFKFKANAPETPDLFVLKLNGQSITLAIDSTETIKIGTSKSTFGKEYTIEGSDASARIKEMSLAAHKAAQTLADLKKQYEAKTLTDDQYLEKVQALIADYKAIATKVIFADLKSLSAYFALFQKIDGYMFFDPYDKADSRVFGAVATSWDVYHKGTPRANHLHDFTLGAIQSRRKAELQNSILENVQEGDQAQLYDINLPTIKGDMVALSSFKGKVVLLDFTAYQAEYSPAHNSQINKLHVKFGESLGIYQVSFDSDLHFWQNAASNLPWICVRDDKSLNSKLVYRFNIQELPTLFLLNKNGEIIKRLSSSDNIEAEIQKLL